jgi:hypothetical protein
MPAEFPEQQFEKVWVNNKPYDSWHRQDAGLPLGGLDAVTAFELLRDLTEVTAR